MDMNLGINYNETSLLYLNNGEIKFVERWIWEGAPENGVVVDPTFLNDTSIYEAPEFVPLDPPIYGLQYHIPPFDVLPNTEREFLYYVPPVESEYFINRVKIIAITNESCFFMDNCI